MIMYGAVLPSYGDKSKGTDNHNNNETINADDPKNKKRVRFMMFGCG
jgi:hypothetical protein